MATEIPATAEVILKTDASKQFLDTLLGQGWDAWGQGLGGSQAAELMLQLFSAFNLVALAVIPACRIWPCVPVIEPGYVCTEYGGQSRNAPSRRMNSWPVWSA
ncbi:MAG: hypothetical protein LBB60_05825 [Desulfovibrio sp.]|jgi:hypothetical protein|nr:hypothetical protein [Desulfovibrio sp.]